MDTEKKALNFKPALNLREKWFTMHNFTSLVLIFWQTIANENLVFHNSCLHIIRAIKPIT